MAEDKKYFVCKIQGRYLTLDLKPVYEKVLFEGTERECYEFVEKELERIMFEKETDERTKQYMNEHTEKYNCENTKLETDNYNAGLEQGYEKGFQEGAEFAYNKANEWHNIKENPTDLPNDGELVVADNGLTIECVKFRTNEFGNSWKHDEFELCDVIYWKKLVLSKDRNK